MNQQRKDNIKGLSELHKKPETIHYQYGTAGFRTLGNVLDSVLFRVGILAGLRSQYLHGKTIGVMVTASHNPEADNGVKLVDPHGEMLESSWEVYATTLANAASSDALITALDKLVQDLGIDTAVPASVVYAYDTRPSGPALVASLEDGFKAIGANARKGGVTTTPVLHYLVRTINTKGTPEAYGDDSEDAYYSKLANAYKKLVHGLPPRSPIIIDCANGVGAFAATHFAKHLNDVLPFTLYNTATTTPGALNSNCGADFVKTQQKLPPSLEGHIKPGERACSLDGDADRLMYFYLDQSGVFRMLDGDKIGTLVAAFIGELVEAAGLADSIKVGIVQTAYANGASTKYLSSRVPVTCVPTGVKHLHHAAESYDVGVYFEANGHGTVLFSPKTLSTIASHKAGSDAQASALTQLATLVDVINQTVGDALSDMLLVEAVLAHKKFDGAQWDALYADLPNRLVKVVVKDRNVFTTTDAERKLVTPEGLQAKVDALVAKVNQGRSFVRPSGTEDVVRVYAEAATREEADKLAFSVGGLVYDHVGGDPAKRPAEFI